MKRATVLGSLGVLALVALAPVLSCSSSSSGGGSEPAGFTDSDRAAMLDQMTAATTSISLAIAGSLFFLPAPPTKTTSKSVLTPQSAGTLSCTTASGSTCSCTYGGEIVQCHVTIDEQDLCDVSGSRWLTGRVDATGTPVGATVVGDVTLKLGPPPCVVSSDGLTLDGTFVTTVSAQSTGDVFHMVARMFSNGITATRGGKEVGVCLVDVTITEAGASGTMCGKAFPPAMPPTNQR